MNKTIDENKPMIISYMTLRKAIGWLGILLPFALLIGNYLISWFTDFETGCNPFKSSISHYYYTRMGELFVGTLCAVALFLFCYKGKEKIDSHLSNLAGFFALGIITFPTSADLPIPCNLRGYMSHSTIGTIHFTMATLFFLTLASISFFIFTKNKGYMTDQKYIRNIIYKICSIVIVACLAGIAIYIKWLKQSHPTLEDLHPVFWFEAIALVAFGFSWLTKGEFLLKDK